MNHQNQLPVTPEQVAPDFSISPEEYLEALATVRAPVERISRCPICMKDLIGTEKQVQWAETIRANAIAYIEKKAAEAEALAVKYQGRDEEVDIALLIDLEVGTLWAAFRLGNVFKQQSHETVCLLLGAVAKRMGNERSARWWIESRSCAKDYFVSHFCNTIAQEARRSSGN